MRAFNSRRLSLPESGGSGRGWLLFRGVGSPAVAFAVFAFALRHMNASALGITTYLIPPLTIVMSVLLLSEAPPAAAYLGGALTFVGVAVTQTDRRARRPAQVSQQTDPHPDNACAPAHRHERRS